MLGTAPASAVLAGHVHWPMFTVGSHAPKPQVAAKRSAPADERDVSQCTLGGAPERSLGITARGPSISKQLVSASLSAPSRLHALTAEDSRLGRATTLRAGQERSLRHLHRSEMESPSSRHCKGMTAASPQDCPTPGRFVRRLFRDWNSYAELRSPQEKTAILRRIRSGLSGGGRTNLVPRSGIRRGRRHAKRRTRGRTGV